MANKQRFLVFYQPGTEAPFKITGQIDHTWFLTVFGNDKIGRPFNAQEFIEFVHANYDKRAIFEMDFHGIVRCKPMVRFNEMDIAHKFLDDFTQILEKLTK